MLKDRLFSWQSPTNGVGKDRFRQEKGEGAAERKTRGRARCILDTVAFRLLSVPADRSLEDLF